MKRIETVIVGAGQAGLAMSRCLAERGVDHVVLEKGRIGERWRSQRWDSLRLLTPNWQSRLPGYHYRGADPHGFMTRLELVAHLEAYARVSSAPVEEETEVERVTAEDGGYRVVTTRGTYRARTVVVSTGHCDVPNVPAMAGELGSRVHQVTSTTYRNPSRLPEGGVLVVGASATGLQLAEEIQASGRPVTLAVGRHTRLPRMYRGRDIMWWLDRMGVLDDHIDDMRDPIAARNQPSMQLVGRADHRSLDLGQLAEGGVRLVGRAVGAASGSVRFADDLALTTGAADAKLQRLLAKVDAFSAATGLGGEPEPPVVPLSLGRGPLPRALDLAHEGIRTVLWATGFSRRYPWLQVDAFDGRGELDHRSGVTRAPGLYVLGLRFMRRRKSSFIDGVGEDAEHIASELSAFLSPPSRRAA